MSKVEELKQLPPLILPTGKDEMNLAEFPFTLLSNRISTSTETIEFSDIITGKGGKSISREWIVTGNNKFGLPLACDEELYVAMMKLTKDNGLKDRKVNFTRYKLIKTLGWSNQGKNYARIEEGLKRLKGVSIYAKNAFWDNEAKLYVTVSFGIIDNLNLYDEQPGRSSKSIPLSYFSWNEVLFNSFNAGFIKNLDVDFYFSLDGSISKRLYRFLDKNKYGKSRYEIRILKLASLLPIQDRHPSQIKRRLEDTHSQLIEKGFLNNATYEKGKTGEEKVVYRFSKVLPTDIKNSQELAGNRIVNQLTQRGITESVADILVNDYSTDQIQKQIEIFDHLVKTKSQLVAKNPAGFLRKSIEENYQPPSEYNRKQEKEIIEQKKSQEMIEKEIEQTRFDEIQCQVDEYRDNLTDEEKQLLKQEATELIDNDKQINKQFVTEPLILAKENDIIRERLSAL
jgi:hypothetical protein